MVKGVNKNIIEINNTGNKYFERVILFISSDYSFVSTQKLEAEADNYLLSLDKKNIPKYSIRSKHLKRQRTKLLLISIGLIALFAFCLIKFI